MAHAGKLNLGFKEIKQEIGSVKSQVRDAHAVINRLNFCMMATTLTWIYADRIKADPERRHLVKGRTSFAFSDVRRLMTKPFCPRIFLGFGQINPNPSKIPPDYVQASAKFMKNNILQLIVFVIIIKTLPRVNFTNTLKNWISHFFYLYYSIQKKQMPNN